MTSTPAPAGEKGQPEWLDREAAAAWFQGRGLSHIKVTYLRDLASAGRGPRYHRHGRYVYYAVSDLEAWLRETLRPVEEGRAAPRAA